MIETDDDFAELLLIPGVGRAKARALFSAGYRTLEDLLKADLDTLSDIPGIGTELASGILEFAKLMSSAQKETKKEMPDTKPSLFICPICGSIIGANSKSCPSCGIEFSDDVDDEQAQESMKKIPADDSAGDGFWYDKEAPRLYMCPECGSLISKKAGKCENCGAEFSTDDMPEAEPSLEDEKNKKDADGFWYKDNSSLFLCPNCGAFIPKDAKNCKTCGVVFEGEEDIAHEPEVTACPNCGQALAPGSSSCSSCGFQFDVKKKDADGFWYKEGAALFVCPNCGAFISEGAEQCSQCGIVFEGVEAETPTSESDLKTKEEEFEHSLYLCATCGAFVSSTADKCAVCGTSVDEVEKAVEEPEFKIPKMPEDISAEIAAEIEEIEAETLEAPKKSMTAAEKPEEKPKRGISKDFLTRWKKTGVEKEPTPEDEKKRALELTEEKIEKELGLDILLVPEDSDADRLTKIDSQLEKEPGNYNLWEEKASILDSIGRKDEAVACLDKAAELNPERETEYKKRILVILGVGIEKDLEDITELLSLDKDGKASVEEDLVKEKTEKLLADVDKKLADNPNDEALWVEKGEFLEKLGRHEEAIKCFDQSIRLSYSDMEKETEGMILTPKMVELSFGLTDSQGRVNGRVNGLPARRGLINGSGRVNGLVNGRGRTNGLVNGRGRTNGLINGGMVNGLVNGRGRTNGLVNGRGRTNGLVNGGMINGLINGGGRTNGLVNGGLINGLGLVNGEGMINGRGGFYSSRRIELSKRSWRYRLSWIVVLIALVLIVPMFTNMLNQPDRGIAIDGNFADWDQISTFYDNPSDQIYNPDLNIIESKVVYSPDRIDLFLEVEGTALGGRQVGNITNMADSILVFVDIDSNPSTGYIIDTLGADLMVDAWGWDNNVHESATYLFRSDAARNDWGGFSRSSSAPCTAENNGVELRIMIPVSLSVAGQNPRLLAITTNSIGQTDATDFVISQADVSIVMNSHSTGPDVLAENGRNVELVRLEVKSCAGRDSIHELNFTILGSAVFADIQNIKAFNDSTPDGSFNPLVDSEIPSIASSANPGTFNIRFNAPFDVPVNRSQTMFIVADLAQSASLKTLGLKLDSSHTANSLVTINNLDTIIHKVGVSGELVVDGAFGDWINFNQNADRPSDIVSPSNNFTVINRNIDLADTRLGTESSLFVFFSVYGVMLGGSDVPTFRFRPGPAQPTPLTDSDQDTVPDIIDGPNGDGSTAFDFNNDGVNNSLENGDFDSDGVAEYPRGGTDYWLNTTIPPNFPSNFTGNNIRVYVGPIGHEERFGEERAYVLIDSDDNQITGTSIQGGVGIDYVVMITGKANVVWSSQLFRYYPSGGTTPWLLIENVTAAIDWYRLELELDPSIVDLSGNDFALYIALSDWLGNYDTCDSPLNENSLFSQLSGRGGTRSPAGDNIVINEISTRPNNNEWIELCNPTGAPINIGGWRLRLGFFTTLFTFPANTILGAFGSGTEYLVVTFYGPANDLPNGGGTIRLQRNLGGWTTLDQTTYPGMVDGESWGRIKNATYGMPTDTDNDANDWYVSNNNWYGGSPIEGPTARAPNDVRRPVISIEKIGSVSTTSPGMQLTFTIYYNNTGDGNARYVWLNDTLPVGMGYVSSSIPYTSYSGSTYRWTLTNVTPGAHSLTVTATVNASVPIGTVLTNLAELNYTDQLSRPMGYSRDTWNVTVTQPQPIIAVSKVADRTLASPGDTVTYTIYYNNTGSGTAANVWINDTLPAGMNYVLAIPAPGTISGQIQYWSFTNVSPGTMSITLVANVSSGATPGTILTNTVTCSYTNASGGSMPGSSDSVSITVTLASPRILMNEISIQGNTNEWVEVVNPTATSVDISGWRINVPGSGTAYTFPAGTILGPWGSGTHIFYVNTGGNDFPNGGATVNLQWNNPGPGWTTIDSTTYPGGISATQTWSRFKHEDTGRPADTNNTADWYISNNGWIIPEGPTPAVSNTRKTPVMWINKTVDTSITGPGDTITYTIWYNNTGDGNAKRVWVNDTLPNGVNYLSSNIAYTSASGNTYYWYFPNVVHDSTNSFTITAIVNSTPVDGSTLTNRARCNYTDQLGISQQEKFANASVIFRKPIITVEKVVDLANANAGDMLTYTIYYNNTGTANAGTVWVNDTLPQWIDYVSSSAPYASVNGQIYGWVFTSVAPGSHSFTITAQVNASAPSHNATNWAFLNYTSIYNYGLPGSSDFTVTVIPEFQDMAIAIFGLLAITIIGLNRKRRKKNE
jgi:uncharacterized repeat protein (TIGR01451 family)